MAHHIKVNGKSPKRGVRMRIGSGWRLIGDGGQKFTGRLLGVHNIGTVRVALFRVRK